jgi:hypothetical protein
LDNSINQPRLVRVRFTQDEDLARSYVLTLVAMDMRAVMTREAGGFGIHVSQKTNFAQVGNWISTTRKTKPVRALRSATGKP